MRRERRSARLERFRHDDAMTLLAVFKFTRHSELFSSGFNETIAPIDAWQLRAKTEDADIDCFAPLPAKTLFGGREHLLAEPAALVSRVHCKHS